MFHLCFSFSSGLELGLDLALDFVKKEARDKDDREALPLTPWLCSPLLLFCNLSPTDYKSGEGAT